MADQIQVDTLLWSDRKSLATVSTMAQKHRKTKHKQSNTKKKHMWTRLSSMSIVSHLKISRAWMHGRSPHRLYLCKCLTRSFPFFLFIICSIVMHPHSFQSALKPSIFILISSADSFEKLWLAALTITATLHKVVFPLPCQKDWWLWTCYNVSPRRKTKSYWYNQCTTQHTVKSYTIPLRLLHFFGIVSNMRGLLLYSELFMGRNWRHFTSNVLFLLLCHWGFGCRPHSGWISFATL